MQISFILAEPATPENVGSVARALKTMGFDDLRLINPYYHLSPPSRWLTHASNDINLLHSFCNKYLQNKK